MPYSHKLLNINQIYRFKNVNKMNNKFRQYNFYLQLTLTISPNATTNGRLIRGLALHLFSLSWLITGVAEKAAPVYLFISFFNCAKFKQKITYKSFF